MGGGKKAQNVSELRALKEASLFQGSHKQKSKVKQTKKKNQHNKFPRTRGVASLVRTLKKENIEERQK